MSFKIIAIRPLNGCSSAYLKLLEPGNVYTFYREFEINDVDLITVDVRTPPGLYSIKSPAKKIDINISAISGKNGSGKSTLIELLFLAINNLSIKFNTKNKKADLTYVDGIRVEFYFQTDSFYKIRIWDKKISVFVYKETEVANNFAIAEEVDNYKLHDFFYTVTINYSHYAYNTNEMGKWLNGLFHKNDAYQTPLVLNPKRDRGNFDINVETYLAKSRLISNLLIPNKNIDFKKLTDNLTATEFTISWKKSKSKSVLYELTIPSPEKSGDAKIEEVRYRNLKIDKELIFEELRKYYKILQPKKDLRIYIRALNYVIYKLVNICLTYDEYEPFFSKEDKNFLIPNIKLFFKKLFVDDKSHITFKLKQTLNFLRFQHIDYKNGVINIDSLSKTLSAKVYANISRIELIPPPIFNIDIILEPNGGLKKIIEFKMLSSGERQMIYSVSSILYHLLNLDSIKTTRSRTSYRYVNIILEEIELYFHPEMQRIFINHIIEQIGNIGLNNIVGVNFCFVSHSPFILSDIPKENIMFLKVINNLSTQIKDVQGTFGANIYDLLKDGFFMDNGHIGEFAKRQIDKTISWLNDNLKDLLNHDKDLNNRDSQKDHFRLMIEIVDEPIVKRKLTEMYLELYQDDKEQLILAEIERLSNEIGYKTTSTKKE